jgi:hypothetical protein
VNRIVLVVVTAALVACGTSKSAQSAQPVAVREQCGNGPEWTCFRSGACQQAEFKGQLCAVGSVSNVANYSLGVNAATAQARAEMANVWESQVQTFTGNVVEELQKAGKTDDIQKISNMVKTASDRSLSGVSVPKTHFNKETKTIFAMALADPKTFKDAIDGLVKASQLSQEAKEEVTKRAASVEEDFGKVINR